MVADHLSWLRQEHRDDLDGELPIDDFFPNEQLLSIASRALPWYANYVNYLACRILPLDLTYQQKKRFLFDVKDYSWEESLLFKRCNDGLVRRCLSEEEVKCLDSLSLFSLWWMSKYLKDYSKSASIRFFLAKLI